jgi:predicted dinucleotide-utilizing enzyme
MKSNLKVGIIGCGGIGSYFIRSLSEVIKKDISGFNKLNCMGIDLYDFDLVEEKNLSYQNFDIEHLDRNKAEVLAEITGYKAIIKAIDSAEQLKDYDLVVLCVDNNKVRQVVYNSGIKFLDLRASGKTFMAYLTEKDDTEYLSLTEDTGAKGGCQREEDLEDRHIQFGNLIIASIGIQLLADYLRGEITQKKIIMTI